MVDGATVRSQAEAEVDQRALGSAMSLRRVHRTAIALLLVGLLITSVLAAAAWSAFRSNEDRLLDQRASEGAAVLSTAISVVESPVSSAAELVVATEADPAGFRAFMTAFVGERGRFSSASVWAAGDVESGPTVVVGEQPVLAELPASDVRAFFERQVEVPSLKVLSLLQASPPRLGYSWGSPGTDPAFVVYVEQTLAEDRTSVPPPGSAFADLDYALYLGGGRQAEDLIFASTPDLPLDGHTDTAIVPLGDTDLHLVMSPIGYLGGGLLRFLPWLILGTGGLIALGFATLYERVLRRRDHAEELVAELARVAEDNARLYGEQRSVAKTLQQSLLPESLPDVAGLELAARYEPGADGVDVGGDWYDVIPLESGRAIFIVGDVSGRGIRAATVMAGLRYSIRAYAAQGDGPASILTRLGDVVSVTHEGHFATVLVGEVDPATGTVVIANAGHPNPLLLDESGAAFVDTEVGVPVGVATAARYETVTVALPQGGTLIGFTDGLFERRGETVDVGLERFRASVAGGGSDLEPLLDGLIAGFVGTSQDDAAILAVRWLSLTTTPPT